MNNRVNTQYTDQYDDGIGLREIFSVLWDSKVTIIAITTFCVVASIFGSLSIPNQYKAIVSLAPAQQDSGGLSGALNQFGGLASIAGTSVGRIGSNETQIAKEIMISRSFIENFIDTSDISDKLGAVIGWDKESNQLIYNQDAYDSQAQSWLTGDGGPSSWELYQSFSGMLAIEEHMNLVEVSFQHHSPYLAREWLDMYVEAINKHMQARQVIKLRNNIEHLQRQIKKTSITDMRVVLQAIIEENIKSKMLAEANPDYVFTIVVPSMVPEERSQPNRALICIFGAFMGGMLSVIWVFVLRLFRIS